MISRILETNIRKRLDDKKAIVIIGARQVGKTTLLETIFKNEEGVLWLTGDEPDVKLQRYSTPRRNQESRKIGKLTPRARISNRRSGIIQRTQSALWTIAKNGGKVCRCA